MAEIETLTAKEREELEWPMPHRTQPKALRIIDAQAARITELEKILENVRAWRGAWWPCGAEELLNILDEHPDLLPINKDARPRSA